MILSTSTPNRDPSGAVPDDGPTGDSQTMQGRRLGETLGGVAVRRGAVVGLSRAGTTCPVNPLQMTFLEGEPSADIAGAGLIPNPATVDGPRTAALAHRVEESCALDAAA
jgi:hypothetical protein